jgi:hypothetical protein
MKNVQMFQCSYKEMMNFNNDLTDYKKIIYPFNVFMKSRTFLSKSEEEY